MKTIAIMSRKGGAGKTTLAVNLAIHAHAEGDRRVLLIDSDPQRSAALSLRGRTPPGPHVAEAAAGKLFQACVSARRDGYNLVVIDTPAHPEADVAQAANMADLCVVVARPTFLDIASVVHSGEMIRRLGRRGVVALNQAPIRRAGVEPRAVRRAVEALALTGLPHAGSLSSRVAFQQSLAEGRSAAEWGAAPAGEEMAGLWAAVSRHLQPEPVARDRVPAALAPLRANAVCVDA